MQTIKLIARYLGIMLVLVLTVYLSIKAYHQPEKEPGVMSIPPKPMELTPQNYVISGKTISIKDLRAAPVRLNPLYTVPQK